MRARYPDVEDFVERDGVKIGYEVYGTGEPTILLIPTWAIVHARRGRHSCPTWRGTSGWSWWTRAATVAPTDRTARALHRPATHRGRGRRARHGGRGRAVAVGISAGGRRALQLAAGIRSGCSAWSRSRPRCPSGCHRTSTRCVSATWVRRSSTGTTGTDYPDFVEFFFTAFFTEPHSTKQIEDCVGYGLETTGETLIHTVDAPGRPTRRTPRRSAELFAARCSSCTATATGSCRSSVARPSPNGPGARSSRCPARGTAYPATGAREPPDPGVRGTLRPELAATRRWRRPLQPARRALFMSSPIGLGHARRDIAIAAALREQRPEIEIDWLAQSPVTDVVTAHGERVHPASRWLASESAHIESEAGEHDLRVFEAIRRMDEIMVANFMVFDDVVRQAALRPVGRRRGLGDRPLPAREPRAQDAPPTPG